ncbi:MAG: hypothetical protein K8R59_11785 [Thermoanaerobaculales bacterium]|nr:hypothetical protein [Thermoanaerobaculales bacterium]
MQDMFSTLDKGGFPAALKIAEPERLLQQYFNDTDAVPVRFLDFLT